MELLGTSAVEIFFDLADASFTERQFTPIHLKIKPKLVIRESTSHFHPNPASSPSGGSGLYSPESTC